jgi:hypothetical protein
MSCHPTPIAHWRQRQSDFLGDAGDRARTKAQPRSLFLVVQPRGIDSRLKKCSLGRQEGREGLASQGALLSAASFCSGVRWSGLAEMG